MVEYGCNVANKFGFDMSDDEDIQDPREFMEKAAKVVTVQAAAVKKAPVQEKAVKKEETAKPSAAKEGKENRPAAGERGRGGRGGRGRGGPREGGNRPPREGGDLADRFGESGTRGRGGNRGRGGPRPFRGRGGNTGAPGADDAGKENFEEVVSAEGGEARPPRRDRPDRGDRPFRPRGGRGAGRGRQFDRQSGSDRTGVRPTDKKEGHGKGNWGDVNDEIAGETEPVAVEGEPQEPAAPREKTAEELQYEADLAEYSKMKTLKEFKAEQKGEQSGFKTRRAGEGVQENFGKLVPLPKSQDNKEDEVIVVRKESSKKVVNIDIHFLESNRGRTERGGAGGRGGRGGRGGDRGGRGGPRPARSHGAGHFDASSTEDFPALK